MTAPLIDNGRRTGAYIIGEAEIDRSREQIIVASGNVLEAGTVLGKVTASKKYVALNLAAADGSQNVAGILYGDTNAAAADNRAVAHVRDCSVSGHELVWPVGISDANKTAAIAAFVALGVIVRF